MRYDWFSAFNATNDSVTHFGGIDVAFGYVDVSTDLGLDRADEANSVDDIETQPLGDA